MADGANHLTSHYDGNDDEVKRQKAEEEEEAQRPHFKAKTKRKRIAS